MPDTVVLLLAVKDKIGDWLPKPAMIVFG